MAIPEETLAVLVAKFAAVLPRLDERQRRLYLASEAEVLGHGGITAVARLAEVSKSTITRGWEELATGAEIPAVPVGAEDSLFRETPGRVGAVLTKPGCGRTARCRRSGEQVVEEYERNRCHTDFSSLASLFQLRLVGG
ncbi:hypothetical protein ACIOWI_37530 [Streptomyces sp. NPDC087659]|uniref:hypothetical protein n=1 Tax=Streptomyces sp. NPDC087659 TaxID=3365801 RepID=UPI0038001C47